MITCLTIALLPLAGCSVDMPTAIDTDALETSGYGSSVADLRVLSAIDGAVTLAWTEVDDGAGTPANYQVKYGSRPMTWGSGTVGCDTTIDGERIGAEITCEISGLEGGVTYDVQVASFSLTSSGAWRDAHYSNVVVVGTAEDLEVGAVSDLSLSQATVSSLTVRWTQIAAGAGEPATYRVKYARPPISWGEAETACLSLEGTEIGATMTCTLEGLDGGADYDVQLMSYHDVGGVWEDAKYSNVVHGRTVDQGTAPAQSHAGLWISSEELAALPTSGPAWESLRAAADKPCGPVLLSDQAQSNNVCIMAKALVFARTGIGYYRTDVVSALAQLVALPSYDGRALALGRGLGAYVIAADLIDLKTHQPALDLLFRTTIRALLTAPTSDGPTSLVQCHERRPNNWGTHCGGARAAVAAYLGDTAELARVAQVFQGWLGDRSAYAGFSFGDTSWQCDPSKPVPVNPAGCTRDGYDIGGVLPDDQRRAGAFHWPAPHENYVWEALQGAVMQAVILERAGYPAFEWQGQALRRAVEWLYVRADYPAAGDDTWMPYVLNHYYGTTFPAPNPARAGKNAGWTDWTHGR